MMSLMMRYVSPHLLSLDCTSSSLCLMGPRHTESSLLWERHTEGVLLSRCRFSVERLPQLSLLLLCRDVCVCVCVCVLCVCMCVCVCVCVCKGQLKGNVRARVGLGLGLGLGRAGGYN